jgi:hypothetical protein
MSLDDFTQRKYINNHQMHFNVYDVLYSKYSQEHVLAAIPAIFREMLSLQ